MTPRRSSGRESQPATMRWMPGWSDTCHERQYSPRRPYLQQDRAKRLGAKRVVRIEGGHLPMLSKPDELAEVIAEFVSQAERKE